MGCLMMLGLSAQRVYTSNSVLSSGTWYRIAIPQTGVYKIDAAFLTGLGFSAPVSSAQIRLYGNGGKMLAESNRSPRADDLLENAILMEDGGDGNFSGTDYFLA